MATSPPAWREMDLFPDPGLTEVKAELVIVGAGPIGLALAIDLALRGQKVVILERRSHIAAGSKAICYSKRSLDILDRLGVGEAVVDRGVCWEVGKVFWGGAREPIYQFDLLPEKQQKMPAFVNLQQYVLEEMLVERAGQTGNVEIRWGHEVIGLQTGECGALLEVQTAQGHYRQSARWLVACDGNRSTIRGLLGLEFDGKIFEDNFLIADIRMDADRPSERWFWFDPPFNPGRTALLHKQPDNVWRLDFQLGWDIDRDQATRPERVARLIKGMLGDDIDYEPIWYSIYTFQCRRMASFVHGRVIFAGDSAHLVSPFGARGCNGGFADIDNLAWKLDLVVKGEAKETLLETYNSEAVQAADENVLHSTRSTNFITPRSEAATVLRNAVLSLAKDNAFARSFVNSGRLATAVHFRSSLLSIPDCDDWHGRGIAPGAPAIDAPLANGWLLERLKGKFVFLTNGSSIPVPPQVEVVDLTALPNAGVVIERFALPYGAGTLLRPDQYVLVRWKAPTFDLIHNAWRRAMTEQTR